MERDKGETWREKGRRTELKEEWKQGEERDRQTDSRLKAVVISGICWGKHSHQRHQDNGGDNFFDNGADACSGNAFNYPGCLLSLFGRPWVQPVCGQSISA